MSATEDKRHHQLDMEYQTTIQSAITLSGPGLHTGKMSHLTLLPAEADTGIVFRRTDLCPPVDVPVSIATVRTSPRNSLFAVGEASVATIEHLLSALHGMQIDNVLAEIDCEEAPILDGSAMPWLNAIKSAGTHTLSSERTYFTIQEPLCMSKENGVEYIAMPDDHFRVTCIIDYPNSVIGKQVAEYSDQDAYETELAPCRTFVLLHEIMPLLELNLIKGGALENALVFVDHPLDASETAKIAAAFGRESADVKVNRGLLNTCKPFFDNEPARHKLLDFVGDITMLGPRVKGHVIIRCPGHRFNAEFARILMSQIDASQKTEPAPKYTSTTPALLDINAVRNFLPHRYPFLLVDKIIELDSVHVVGIKNITVNEPMFQGHFPDEPIFPGVLQIEAMAQVGGLMMMHQFPNPEGYSTLLARVDNVKFRRPVVPGDTLVMQIQLIAPLRRGYLKMKGCAYVGDELATEATLLAQINKKH